MADEIQVAAKVGHKLVDLCREGKFRRAIEDLYADDARHVEACGSPDMPAVKQGKDELLKMNDWWEQAHDIHAMEIKGPYPHRNGQFAVWMNLDVTAKEGPMAGKRMNMDEVCVYRLKGEKIDQVEFYWDPASYGM